MGAIQQIKDKLPFLIDLSGYERRSQLKLGNKSRAFVAKAVEVADQNIELLPSFFDLDEFKKDVKLFADLNSIRIAFLQLAELIDDTIVVSGSDAYKTALEVYGHAKAAGTGPALDELRAMMARRFPKNHTHFLDH